MTDYFALLGQERRPWIDLESLKKKFLSLSAELHPDRMHGGTTEEKLVAQRRYAELNTAYNTLGHSKERLHHLLELETGVKPQQVQQIPAGLTDFFLEAGQLFKQVDQFLTEKARASSPLLQVQLFETGQLWTEKLNALQKRLNERQEEARVKLQALDQQWMQKNDSAGRSQLLPELEQLYRLFGYYTRWAAQLQERVVQLSL
jgi:curved DNA-binding protein CbpA